VADSTISAIDRFFDALDRGAEIADRVVNRTKYTEEQQHRVRNNANKKAPEVIDTTAAVRAHKPSPSTALATRQFRIVETAVPETGVMIFVVTNGSVRAECTTRELAEKILRGLETTP